MSNKANTKQPEHNVRRIEFNFKQGEKLCISPLGDVTGLDGRFYKVDASAIQASLNTHIPLFENHRDYDKAIGWFSKDSLEVRADGLYASLELNKIGQELFDNRYYRYLSPTYYVNEDRSVSELVSIGLVNQPNLLFTEANNKDVTMSQAPAPTVKLVAAEANQVELDRLRQENTRLAQENKTHEVNGLIAQGKLFEPQRALAMTLEANALQLMIDANSKIALSGKLDMQAPAAGGGAKVELNERDKATCKALGVSEDAYLAAKQDT
jgi:phage I-like protein